MTGVVKEGGSHLQGEDAVTGNRARDRCGKGGDEMAGVQPRGESGEWVSESGCARLEENTARLSNSNFTGHPQSTFRKSLLSYGGLSLFSSNTFMRFYFANPYLA